MNNKRVTVYQIAIPLDFKVAINASITEWLGIDAVCQALNLYLLPEN